MADYRVTVGLDVIYDDLNKAKREIKSLDGTKFTIKPSFDAKKFKKEVGVASKATDAELDKISKKTGRVIRDIKLPQGTSKQAAMDILDAIDDSKEGINARAKKKAEKQLGELLAQAGGTMKEFTPDSSSQKPTIKKPTSTKKKHASTETTAQPEQADATPAQQSTKSSSAKGKIERNIKSEDAKIDRIYKDSLSKTEEFQRSQKDIVERMHKSQAYQKALMSKTGNDYLNYDSYFKSIEQYGDAFEDFNKIEDRITDERMDAISKLRSIASRTEDKNIADKANRLADELRNAYKPVDSMTTKDDIDKYIDDANKIADKNIEAKRKYDEKKKAEREASNKEFVENNKRYMAEIAKRTGATSSSTTSDSASDLSELKDKTVNVTVKADTTQAKTEINSLIQTYDGKNINLEIKAKTESPKAEIKSLIETYDGKNINLDVKANTETAKTELNLLDGKADGEVAKIDIGANTEKAEQSINSLSAYAAKKTVKVKVDAILKPARDTINKLSAEASKKIVKIKVDAILKPARDTISKLSAEASKKTVKVKVDAILKPAKDTLNKLSADAKGETAYIKVDANTKPARAEIESLVTWADAKRVTISVDTNVDKDGLTRDIQSASHTSAKEMSRSMQSIGTAADDASKKIQNAVRTGNDAAHGRASISRQSSLIPYRATSAVPIDATGSAKYDNYNRPIRGAKEAYREARHLETMLGNVRSKYNKTEKGSSAAKELEEQMRYLEDERDKVYKNWNDQFTTRQRNALKRMREKKAFQYDSDKAAMSDKELRKAADQAYDDYKHINKRIADNEKMRQGLSNKSHLAKQIDRENKMLKQVRQDMSNEWRDKWTDKQLHDLAMAGRKGDTALMHNEAKLKDKSFADERGRDFDRLKFLEDEQHKFDKKLAKADENSEYAKKLKSERDKLEAERAQIDKDRENDWTENQKARLKNDRDRRELELKRIKDEEKSRKASGTGTKKKQSDNDERNAAYDDMRTRAYRIASNKRKLQSLDEDSELAKTIKAENEKLAGKVRSKYSEYGDKLTKKQKASLEKFDWQNELNEEQYKAAAEDKKRREEAKTHAQKRDDAFNRAKKIEQDIARNNKELEGLDKNSKLAKEISSQNDALAKERKEIDDKWSKEWTEKQAKSLKQVKDDGEDARKRKAAAVEDKDNKAKRDRAFKKIQEIDKEANSNKKALEGLDKNSKEAKRIRKRNAELARQRSGIDKQWNKHWTDEQKAEIEKIKEKGVYEVERKKARQEDKDIAQRRKDSANSDFTKANNAASKIAKNNKKLVGLDENSELAKEIQKQNAKHQSDLNKAMRSQSQWTKRQREALQKTIKNGEDDVNQEKAKLRDKIAKNVDAGKFSDSNNEILDDLRDLNKESDETRDSFNRLKDAHDELIDARDSGDTERLIKAEKEYNEALKETRENIEKDRERDGRRKKKQDLDDDFKNLHGLEDGNRMLDDYSKKLDDIDKKANRSGMSMKRLGIGMVASFAAEGLIQGLMYMFQQILEVDKAMTELKRVTHLTSQEYDKMYDGMIESSRAYGAALSDTIQSTSEWVRLGFDPDTALGLSEVSAMYQHIADVDVATANDNLVTAYKGFEKQLTEDFQGNSVDAINYAADIYNEIGNKFALSSADVGAGLSRAASSLSVAGNTIQESAAMVTGITEVTQDPEKAGNALKIVSMRLRGMKGEVEQIEAGAGEGVESVSKMQTQIMNMTQGRVNIFDKNGDFKSTYEILGDIAEIWDTLSSVDQATLLETIAGKNRANDTAALLSNWQNVEEAMVVATDAEGSAYREHQKYMESIQGHLDVLKSSFQTFATAFLNTDTVIGFVDALSGILDFLTDLTEMPDAFKSIAAAVLLAAVATKIFGTSLTAIFAQQGLQGFAGLLAGFKAIGTGLLSLTSGAGVANKSLLALRSTMATFAATLLPLLAIMAGVAIFNHFAQKQEELEQKVEDINTEFENENDTLKENQKLINKSGTRYVELSKGVSKLGQNVSLTSEEYDEYLDLTNQIGEAIPELIQGYDAEGNVILKVKGEVALEEIQLAQDEKVKEASTKVIDESADIFEEFKNSADDIGIDMESFDIFSQLMNSDDLGKDIDALKEAERFTRLGPFDDFKRFLQETGHGASAEVVNSKDSFDDADWINWLFTEKYKDMQDEYDAIEMAMEEESKGMSSLAEAYINKRLVEDDYKDMSDDMKSVVAGVIPEMDYEFFTQFENYGDMTTYLNNMLRMFKSLGKEDEIAIKSVFELETKYNNGEISVGEYEEGIERFEQSIDGMDVETQKMVKVSLGFDVDEETGDIINDKILDTRDSLLKSLQGKSLGLDVKASEFLVDNLNDKELQVMVDLVAEGKIDKEMIDEYQNAYNEAIANGTDLDRTVYGNVDMDNRQELVWDASQRRTNRKALEGFHKGKSWKEIQAMDDYSDGALSTVLGRSGDYGKDGEIPIAFTPMLQTEDGPVLLSGETTGKYFDKLIDMSTDSKGNVDFGKMMSYDMTGLMVDGKKVNNIIADIGDTAEQTARSMHDVGEGGNIANTELMNLVENEAALKAALDYTIDMEVEITGIEEIKTALAETVSATGLTSASITALKSRYSELVADGYNLNTMFEETANGIHLNRAEFAKMEQAYATKKFEETSGHIETLTKNFDDLSQQLDNPSLDASKRAELLAEQGNIQSQINSLGTLAAQYEGLASSYAAWQAIEESGEERDMYEGVIEGRTNIKDELSRGWFDDGAVEWLILMTGNTDLATASADECMKAYKGLNKEINSAGYSVNDFFTVDAEGNATSTGVWNFLKTVDAAEGMKYTDSEGLEQILPKDLVQKDKDGNIISFDFGVNGDQAVADALGISEELVQIILRAADDAGFVISLDGAYTQMADLQTKAKEAADSIKEDFNISFNMDITDQEELSKAFAKSMKFLERFRNENGEVITVDKNGNAIKGAQDALTIASTYQTMIDGLSEPVYMDIEAGALGKKMKPIIEDAQEYERLMKTRNQLAISSPNSDDFKNTAEEMDAIVDSFMELSDEEKISIGIDGLTRKEVEDKLNAEGLDVDVPAELEISMSMDENLEKLVDIMMYDAGIKDIVEIPWAWEEKHNGAKIDGIDFSKYNETQVLEIETYVVDNKDWLNKLSDSARKAAVDFYMESKDKQFFKGWTSEEQEIAVKFVGNNKDILDKFSEEQQMQLIEFRLANPGAFEQWLNLSDEQREIVFNAILSNPDFLSQYNFDQQTAMINFIANNPDFLTQFEDPIEQQIVLDYIAQNGEDAWNKLSEDDKKKYIKKTKAAEKKQDDSPDGDGSGTTDAEAQEDAANAQEDAAGARTEAANAETEAANAQTEAANAQTEAANAQAAANQSGDKPEPEEKPEEKPEPESKPEPEPEHEEKPGQKPKDTYASDSLLNRTLKWFGKYGDNEIEQGSAGSEKDGEKTKDTYASDSLLGKALKWISESGKEESKDKSSEKPKQEEPKEKPKDTYASDSLLSKALKWIDEGGESYQKIEQGPSDSDGSKKSDSLLVKGLKWFSENNPFKAGTAYGAEITPEVEVNPVNTTADVTVDTNTTVNDTSNQETQATVLGNNTPINTTKSVFAKTDTKVDDTTNQDTESAVNGNNTPINVTKPVTVTTQPFVGGGALSPTAAVGITANVTGQGQVDTLNNTVNALPQNPTVDVKANVTGKGLVDNLAQSIRNLPLTKTVTITTVKKTETVKGGGGNQSPAAGTAHVAGTSGRAFANGNWGINGNGVALGGELGQELVVRDGRFFTIGDQGAEFFKYKKNDIVFNASQTASLFKYGGIKGANPRGKMLASGTAFAQGSIQSSGLVQSSGLAFSEGFGGLQPQGGDDTAKKDTKKNTKKDAKKDTPKDESKEVFDWIEVLIDRIERLIERLGKTADSVYKTWAQRNRALTQSINQTRKEIDLQWQGYNRYIQQANKVGLSEKYKKLVQNGKIDIETIKNEKLAEKIKEYQEW